MNSINIEKLIDRIPARFRQEKYIRFLKYVLSGTIAVVVEMVLFSVFYYLVLTEMENSARTHIANFIARVTSSIMNYKINRRFVFGSEKEDLTFFIKYAAVWVVQLELSSILINFVKDYIGVEPWISKLLFDQLLAFVSYNVQLHWVFKKRGN